MSINRILSWFPSAWRARYETEVRDLLDAHPFGWRERVDLLRACCDAWMREGVSWVWALLRWTVSISIRPAAVFGLGWLLATGAQALIPTADSWLGEVSPVVAQAAHFAQPMLALGVILFVIAPARRDPARRPTWLISGSCLVLLTIITVLAGPTGGMHRAVETTWFGFFATMRFRWFYEEFWPPVVAHRAPGLHLR
jgi:hypothetical protein